MPKKQKYYAVKKGNRTGIFLSWEECQEAIKKFSVAEFKSFESEDEAKAYLSDIDIIYEKVIKPKIDSGDVVAFVDGSYDSGKKIYGYGAYIVAPGFANAIELCGNSKNEKYVDLHNVAGEILAVLNAVDWAWKNGFLSISIFYDYEGIENWANGVWTANQILSRYYQNFIKEKREILKISFQKVKGHSNNKYNDRADALAKSAIAENKVIKDLNGNGGYIIKASDNEIKEVLDILKVDCNGFEYNITKETNKYIYNLQFQKDKLTIQVFNNLRTMVQGKRSNLFHIVTTSIIEHIDCGDFIKVLSQAYDISLKADSVETDFGMELPNISRLSLQPNIVLLLKQAIVDLNSPAKGDVEFSKYTFSALRALEGILKHNLDVCGIAMSSNRFDMFEKVNSVYKLKSQYNISQANKQKIENCYNHYYNYRNVYFHFGIIISGQDVNTRIISTKQEANAIIQDTLHIIDANCI